MAPTTTTSRRATPLAALLLVAALVAAATTATSSSASGLPARVLPLTDATFEHDTQASTGQTTGHWAVLLFDSSAGKTRAAAESAQKALAALAASREQQDEDEETPDPGCLYASVDASEGANPLLAARFRAFLPGPVLLLFRDRQLFPLPLPRVPLSRQEVERAGSGASRSNEQAVSAAYHAILDFLSGGFREVDSERIPPPNKKGGGATIASAGLDLGSGFVGRAVNFIAAQTMELESDPLLKIGVVAVGLGLVTFVGFFTLAALVANGVIFSAPADAASLAAAAAVAAKQKQQQEKKQKQQGGAAGGGKKPAPVPEGEETEEAAAAEGEGEEEEKEGEAAGGSGGARRRRRPA